MIRGMTESTFTTVHVVLSLIGSGLVVMFGQAFILAALTIAAAKRFRGDSVRPAR